MRVQAVMAFAVAALVAGCGGGGWFGSKSKPAGSPADTAALITKQQGPTMVTRCPVPVAYDDATSHKIQEALDTLPKESILRKVMSDYETERDNLRMCQ